MVDLRLARFSILVERIFDCAIDPTRWQGTLQQICLELGFTAGTIMTADYHNGELEFLADWNASPHFQRLLSERFGRDAVHLFRTYAAVQAHVDEPLVASRGPVPFDAYRQSPMFLEWAKPQGYGDSLNSVVLNEANRIGALALMRLEADGLVTEQQIETLRLLAPHLRRSVTIGHLLDMKSINADLAGAALDTLSVAVFLVDACSRILFANRPGAEMLKESGPVRAVKGRLVTGEPELAHEVDAAVSQAAIDEAAIGRSTIGLKLIHDGAVHALVHVLPIARGALRTRLLPLSVAAVFVARPAQSCADIATALANAFQLTPGEQRVLQWSLERVSLGETARRLGISSNTVRTHLAHIFEKTGVTSQTELVRLGADLVPPIRVPGK